MFYTYAHVKPDGAVFYIGKGKDRRAWDKDNRNTYWHNIVNKYGYEVKILANSIDEELALLCEIEAIDVYKRRGFQLCNMTEGGEDNPMRNPITAAKVAKTKREKGQYDGKEISKYNANFKQRMSEDFEFAKNISEKRKKAVAIKNKLQLEKMRPVVLEIRKLRSEGWKLKDLSNKFGLSKGRISDIAKGKTYANIS